MNTEDSIISTGTYTEHNLLANGQHASRMPRVIKKARRRLTKVTIPNQIQEPMQPRLEERVQHNDLKKKISNDITMIFRSVTLCMVMVILTFDNVGHFTTEAKPKKHLLSNQYYRRSIENEVMTYGHATGMILALFGLIVVYSILTALAQKWHQWHIIHSGFSFLAYVTFVTFVPFLHLSHIFKTCNIPLDWITFAIVMWNFFVIGILCNYGMGPIGLQQTYLAYISALMAWMILYAIKQYLPNWSIYIFMIGSSLWDVFSVLAPCGPLRLILETSQERNEIELQPTDHQEQAEEENEGFELGMGDYIFYCVLIGRATAKGDWITILACFVAILFGLCLIITLSSIYKRALPALPLSIGFGIVFYLCTAQTITPFLDELSVQQIFI